MGRQYGRLGDHPRHVLRRCGDRRASPAHIHDELLTADESRPVVAFTGSGGAFCAGPDLGRLPRRKTSSTFRSTNRGPLAIDALAQPVIAQVDGAAIGVGCNLAPGCDPVGAATTARYAQVFPRMGLSVDLAGSRILPQLVGPHRAKELRLPGGELTGAELLQAGLVSRAVSPEELDRVAHKLARRLAAAPKIANAGTNRLLDDSSTLALTETLDREAIAQSLNIPEPDLAEGLAAFNRRREPVFR